MTTQGLSQKSLAAQPADGHIHHWLIETPAGPVSRGQCRGCKEVRLFKNTAFGIDWERGDADVLHEEGP